MNKHARQFVEAILIVGTVEAGVMFLLPLVAPGVSGPAEAAIDAALLSVGVAPLLLWRMSRWNQGVGTRPAGDDGEFGNGMVVFVAALGTLLGITVALGLGASRARRNQSAFDAITAGSCREIRELASRGVYGLKGARGVYVSSREVTREEFAAYAGSRDIEREFPASEVLGAVQQVAGSELDAFVESERRDGSPGYVASPADRTEGHWLVRFAYTDSGESALGADLCDVPGFLPTVRSAVESGEPRLVPPAVFPWSPRPRAMWLLPVYRNGEAASTPDERASSISVVLFLTVDLDMVLDIERQNNDWVDRLVIRSGSVTVAESSTASVDHAGLSSSGPIRVGEHEWVVTARPSAGFVEESSSSLPAVLGMAMTLVTWSVAGVLRTLAVSRRRAVELARLMTRDLHESNRSLTEARTRFELAVEGSRDALFDWNVETGEVYFAPQWASLLGCREREVGGSIAFFFSRVDPEHVGRVKAEIDAFLAKSDGSLDIEFLLRSEGESPTWVLCRAAAIRDDCGRATRVSGSVADISKIKSVEAEMRRLINLDGLTGLASRSALMDRLRLASKRFEETGSGFAVLFFDFDRFKAVNDSLGHDAGDELLCGIAMRLRSNISGSDVAARIGGDEFVILLEDLPDLGAAAVVADRLLEVCAEPHMVRGHKIVSTASIGLVTTEHSTGGATEILRDADAAMYQAKARGRGCVVVLDEAMHAAAMDRVRMEQELRSAIDNNELSLVYQPLVDVGSGRAVGAEALLRWEHPARGLVQPGDFVDVAEESNQIARIGSWVLREACRRLSEWRSRGVVGDDFRVAVNVSKAQLLFQSFPDELRDTVKRFSLKPADIKLEITETTVVDNRADVRDALKQIRRLGFVIAMDDFGTGHSSLSGLHTLPIDELKIDRSFVLQSTTNTRLAAITASIVSLAAHLRLVTIAEGVESPEHVKLLHAIDCTLAQGYYFSPPLSAVDFESWMESRAPSQAA